MATTTETVASAASSATDGAGSSSSTPLSSGTGIGMGIAVAFAVVLIVLVSWHIWGDKRKQRAQRQGAEGASPWKITQVEEPSALGGWVKVRKDQAVPARDPGGV